jgi:hypothetical protein
VDCGEEQMGEGVDHAALHVEEEKGVDRAEEEKGLDCAEEWIAVPSAIPGRTVHQQKTMDAYTLLLRSSRDLTAAAAAIAQ